MSEHGETVTLHEWINAASAAAVEAMRADDSERRMAIARSIGEVQTQLPPELDDLSGYLDALEALLAGADRAVAADLVNDAYVEAFDRVLDAIETAEEPQHRERDHQRQTAPPEPEGESLTLGEMLEQITHDAARVMQAGAAADRARMAQGLEVLRYQAAGAMEWPELAAFLAALQDLLRNGAAPSQTFEPPFDQAWARVEASLVGDAAGPERVQHTGHDEAG